MSETKIESEISGIVFKIETKVGEKINENTVIMTLESMKMEFPVLSKKSGIVTEILVSEEEVISEGQILAVVEN